MNARRRRILRRRRVARHLAEVTDRVAGLENLAAATVHIDVVGPRLDDELGRLVEQEAIRARGGTAWRRS